MKTINIFVLGSTLIFSNYALAYSWQPLPKKAPDPENNPTTEAKVKLGKMLYFDPRFSSTGTISCNSCHNLMAGGEDQRSTSMGVHGKIGGRNAPTVWNSAFHSVQFWDGRASSLEDQAKGPVTNPIEMGMKDLDTAMQRVKAIPGYAQYFDQAFGKNSMTSEHAAMAVAAFERTLITPNSPYDRYARGEKNALNQQQIRGMNTFAGTGCTSCHSGPAFNGPRMASGQGFFAKFPTFSNNDYIKKYDLMNDKGRYIVNKTEADKHNFRVPTLRNITDTAPYFHNGSVTSLNEAVRVMAKTQLNKQLNDNEVEDIVAFLGTLTGEYPEITMPRLPATPGTTVLK